MINLVITFLLKAICKMKGLQLFKAVSYEDLVAADTFRQNIYNQYFAMEYLPITQELIAPPGLVSCWCLRKRDKIVGTVALIDLTKAKSFAASVFDNSQLEYDHSRTYEFTRLTLDRKYQRSDHLYFLLLVYACYRDTVKNGRTHWLACSHKRVMRQIHHFGSKTEVIADNAKFSTDGSYQAQYWSNLILDAKTLSDYRAYLIQCDKNLLSTAVKRYIKRKILK